VQTAPTNSTSDVSGLLPAATTRAPMQTTVVTQPTVSTNSIRLNCLRYNCEPQAISTSTSSSSNSGSKQASALKVIAIFRTLLNVSEKVLDGLPIWGPRAAVATASEVLKSIQVCYLDQYSTKLLIDTV
jgi:hypothetical protein